MHIKLKTQKKSNLIFIINSPASDLEPNELDTIYKVLKKANEMKKEKEKEEAAAAATINPPMDIPVVNVPDYPDRTITPRRGPFKSQGPNMQQHQNKQGLTAPMTDISSSGPNTSLKFFQKNNNKTKQKIIVFTKKSCYFSLFFYPTKHCFGGKLSCFFCW